MHSMTLKHALVAAAVVFGLALGGCSTKHTESSPSKPASASTSKPAPAPSTAPAQTATPTLAPKPASNSVYFAYDRSDIDSAAAAVLDGYVSWLKDHAGISVTVEGNCDERGSREYNLALGQARADRVKDYLVSHGVAASRIDTVSFGEERPVCTDSGEACWAQNRRADIVAR